MFILGFSGVSDTKKFACNAGDLGSIPGFERSPEGTAGQPTPVFLSGEFHGQVPGGLQSMGSQRVRHN